MKRVFFPGLILVFLLIPLLAFAEDVPFEYRTDEAGVHITAYTGKDSRLVIPDTIDGLPVVSLSFATDPVSSRFAHAGYAEQNHQARCERCGMEQPLDSRNRLMLPEALQSIGTGAFAGTAGNVIIVPEACGAIEGGAFSDSSAAAILICNSECDLAPDAFDGCNADIFILKPY